MEIENADDDEDGEDQDDMEEEDEDDDDHPIIDGDEDDEDDEDDDPDTDDDAIMEDLNHNHNHNHPNPQVLRFLGDGGMEEVDIDDDEEEEEEDDMVDGDVGEANGLDMEDDDDVFFHNRVSLGLGPGLRLKIGSFPFTGVLLVTCFMWSGASDRQLWSSSIIKL